MNDERPLTAAEEKALAILRQYGPMNVAEFGERMGYVQRAGPRNNLTGARVLTRLRDRGLVKHEVMRRPRGPRGGNLDRYVWFVGFICDRCGEAADDTSYEPLCPDCHHESSGEPEGVEAR